MVPTEHAWQECMSEGHDSCYLEHTHTHAPFCARVSNCLGGSGCRSIILSRECVPGMRLEKSQWPPSPIGRLRWHWHRDTLSSDPPLPLMEVQVKELLPLQLVHNCDLRHHSSCSDWKGVADIDSHTTSALQVYSLLKSSGKDS